MTVNYNASIDGSTEPDEWWIFRDGDCESYPDSIECGDADGLFINQELGDTLFSNVTNPVIDQVNGFYLKMENMVSCLSLQNYLK